MSDPRIDFRTQVIQNPVRLRYSLASDVLETAGEGLLNLHEANRMDWPVIEKLRFDLTEAQSRIRRIVLDYIPVQDRTLVKDFNSLWESAMKEENRREGASRTSKWLPTSKIGFIEARRYLGVKFAALEALMQSVHELMEAKNWYEPKRDDFVVKVPHEEMRLIEKKANEERATAVQAAREKIANDQTGP